MENDHLAKKEVQLELPGIKTGHYVHMTKDAINFPSKPIVSNSNKDDLFPEEVQLSLAI